MFFYNMNTNILFYLIFMILLFIIINKNSKLFDLDYNNYMIVCAKYNRDVSFLQKIKYINSVVITKNVDVPNKAHEATSYLYYIINNYNNLPENIIFIHDEDESWHHTGKISKNIYKWISEYESNGSTYFEFNNTIIPKVIKDREPLVYDVFNLYWNDLLQESCGDYINSGPETGKCCAQFIVSRDIIKQRPIKFYQNMYNWLINNTHGEGNGDKNDPYSGYYTSRYAEWTWRNIFNNKK